MNKTIKKIFFGVLAFAVLFNACNQLTQYYKVDAAKCTSCYKCVSVCGYGAITVVEKPHTTSDGVTYPTTVLIDPKKCVGCGECHKSCPSKAISLAVEEETVDGTSGASRVR